MPKMRKNLVIAAVLAVSPLTLAPAYATPQTTTSPTGGTLPAGVTKVGGLVVDLEGADGTRVVSQLSASQMYVGFADNNPLLFGTQTGYSPTILGALSGGILSAAFRITLFDGDSAPGNFDFNDNTFSVNGISVGNWSDVTTYRTDSTGSTLISTGTGFGDNILSTGFFKISDVGQLAALYTSLVNTGQMQFRLNDTDPFDNFYDFTQGVDGTLIDVGTGPVVAPPMGAVPEPATWAMMLLGFGFVGGALRSARSRKNKITFATA